MSQIPKTHPYSCPKKIFVLILQKYFPPPPGNHNFFFNQPTVMRNLFCLGIISLLLLAGCNEAPTLLPRLNENEVFFTETLASISPDAEADSIYYVGTEDGVVYIYNSATRQAHALKTPFDRIYKVVREGGDYWVGTRNMGLHLCRLDSDSLVSRRQYHIRVANKATQYSAYDISFQSGGTYVGSSHGLLKLPAAGDTLDILAPENVKAHPRVNIPVPVTSITRLENALYCCSDTGLIRVDMTRERLDSVSIIMPGMHVKSAVIHGNQVQALVNNIVFAIDTDGNKVDRNCFSLPHSAVIQYYDSVSGIHYFIANNNVQIVHDGNVNNKTLFKMVKPSRAVRTSCHNVIAGDPARSQSLLITAHSISHVGQHQNVFDNNGAVKMACTDGKNVYYLIDNVLYRQSKGSNRAVQVKDLNGGSGDVRYIAVSRDTLYYLDSDYTLYKSHLSSRYLLNKFTHDIAASQQPATKKEPTAIGRQPVTGDIFIGVRDGLRRAGDINRDFPLSGQLPGTTVLPFITRFTTADSLLLFGTLNDGIYSIGADGIPRRLGDTARHQFIRDIAVDRNGTMWYITNHVLRQVGGDTMINAMGYNRLLVDGNNHLIGVKGYGLTDFNTGQDYFTDISFTPAACVTLDSTVYVGSPNGIYMFNTTDGIGDKSRDPSRMVILDKHNGPSAATAAVFMAVLLTVIAIVWWWDRNRLDRRSAQDVKNGLLQSLDEVLSVRTHLDDETREQLDKLEGELNVIDTNDRQAALDALAELRPAVVRHVGHAHESLKRRLSAQMQQLKQFGTQAAESHITATQTAIKSHSLQHLAAQIVSNDDAIQRSGHTHERVARYKTMVTQLLAMLHSLDLPEHLRKNVTLGKEPETTLAQIELWLTTDNLAHTIRRVKVQLKKDIARWDETPDGNYFAGSALKALNDALEAMDACDSGNAPELIDTAWQATCHSNVMHALHGIGALLPKYEELYRNVKEHNRIIAAIKNDGSDADTGYDASDLDKLTSHLNKDKASLENDMRKQIRDFVEDFFKALADDERQLCAAIGVEQQRDGTLNQKAQLFAVLLTGTDIAASHLTYALKANDQNLRLVRRQLREAIAMANDDIRRLAETPHATIAPFILNARFGR